MACRSHTTLMCPSLMSMVAPPACPSRPVHNVQQGWHQSPRLGALPSRDRKVSVHLLALVHRWFAVLLEVGRLDICQHLAQHLCSLQLVGDRAIPTSSHLIRLQGVQTDSPRKTQESEGKAMQALSWWPTLHLKEVRASLQE
jgi:hypothetical protein